MADVAATTPRTQATRGASDGPGRRARLGRGVRGRAPRWLTIAGVLALSGAILAFDLSLPSGAAVGALYGALLLASIWADSIRITSCLVLVCSGLVALGWLASEAEGAQWVALLNRGFSFASVWSCGAMAVSRMLATERLRTALEVAPGGMIVTTSRGRIQFANAAARRVLGVHSDDLEGTRLQQFMGAGASLGGLARKRSLVGFAEDAVEPCEITCRRLDGTTFPAEVELRPVRTEIGRMFFVTLRDLSQDHLDEERNERFAAIVQSSPDAIIAKDLQGRVTDWNPGAEAIYGYTAQEIIGRSIAVVFPPDLHAQLDDILSAIAAGQVVSLPHARRVAKDGRTVDVRLTVSPIRDRHGVVVGASTLARDRTSEREAERRMLELSTALSHAMPVMATVGADGLLETVNGPFGGLMARAAGDLVGSDWLELVTPEMRALARGAFDAMLRDGRSDVTARSSSPEERYLELFLVRRLDACARYTGFHLFARDITERVRAEAEVCELATGLAEANRKLQRQAHIDPLTGLLNRRGLQRHVVRLQAGGRRRRRQSAVILVDIDDFKQINDLHGHNGGDRVLIAVAQALERGARVSDLVARIGGDEFLLVLPDTRLGEATLIAERMRTAIAAERVGLGDGETAATCSFGVAALPDAGTTIEQLVEAVALELSHSKSGGKNRVCSGGESSETTPLDEILSGRGLRAVHQPIYDLLENRIVAFELFTRGPHGRYERPEVFLNFLHPGEGSAQLDLACLRTCVEAAATLAGEACIHVNLFPSTLLNVGAEHILAELERAGPGRRFCIELNERDLPGDSLDLIENVRVLKRAGIQIAIDDVGFGNSSLEALVNLEPDVIKIDRACVSSGRDDALERLLRVANVLNARLIAEGIEDEQILERLLALRVRYGQGYLWGRPRPIGPREKDVLWPQPRVARPHALGPLPTAARHANG